MAQRDVNIPARLVGTGFGYKAAAGKIFYGRSLVALNQDGFAVPLSDAMAVAFAGINIIHVDNRDGLDGDANVEVARDVRGFSPSILPAKPSDLNKTVYASDDDALTLTAPVAGAAGFAIGKIIGLDDGYVWIDLKL